MASKDDVIGIIKEIIDPELFIDIWTLGLIYDIEVNDRNVDIKMTFTSVACPAGPELVGEVKSKVEAHEEIDTASVEVVFDPPWEPSEDLKALMGIG
jgi:metal-sulfur cluster biosynthetic enzyme